MKCGICEEPLEARALGERPTNGTVHEFCAALASVGHVVGVCGCSEPPYLGLTQREAAKETVRRLRTFGDGDNGHSEAY